MRPTSAAFFTYPRSATPLGVRRSHRPAAIKACGTAPVASTVHFALTSNLDSPCLSTAPTTCSSSTKGASKRAGNKGTAPARTAQRKRMSSSSLRGNTAKVPGTSTKPPREPTQRTCATGVATVITSS